MSPRTVAAGRVPIAAAAVIVALGWLTACSSSPSAETTVTVQFSSTLTASSYRIDVLDSDKKQVGSANLAPGDTETIHVHTHSVTIVVPKVCTLTSEADGSPIKATIGKGSCSI
ncbi:hypothetical protein [Amnibacterium sp.]|uniref:hypothetical protein n=1 Tax=Amnibacterium sp. TaxID=1872496 RepID=UPI00260474D7|nr:hypothetical protein [Amnibacterium sp.]